MGLRLSTWVKFGNILTLSSFSKIHEPVELLAPASRPSVSEVCPLTCSTLVIVCIYSGINHAQRTVGFTRLRIDILNLAILQVFVAEIARPSLLTCAGTGITVRACAPLPFWPACYDLRVLFRHLPIPACLFRVISLYFHFACSFAMKVAF
jgi:hypothetical protein